MIHMMNSLYAKYNSMSQLVFNSSWKQKKTKQTNSHSFCGLYTGLTDVHSPSAFLISLEFLYHHIVICHGMCSPVAGQKEILPLFKIPNFYYK